MKPFAVIIATALLTATAGSPTLIPVNANKYRDILTKEARGQFGLEANVALLAAQIQTESAWRENVTSYVGACGLGQFMPETAIDLAKRYPSQLSGTGVCSPLWSIRGLTIYDREIYQSIHPLNVHWNMEPCQRWAFTFSAYNGGGGWVARDRKLAQAKSSDPDVWFGSVEKFSTRSAAAFEENRNYPKRIFSLLPNYLEAHWPGSNPCAL